MTGQTCNATRVLDDLAATDPLVARRYGPLVTGFEPLDEVLAGGLHVRDLTLLGGKPGVGKTIAALQWARDMVLDGGTAVVACYEHTPRHLLARLMLMELGALVRAEGYTDADALRHDVNAFAWGARTLDEIADERGLLGDAVACVRAYADRLWFVPSSSSRTGIGELTQAVELYGKGRTALFVDYLQKVALVPDPPSQEEKVTRVAEGLKDLAMTLDCAVVAVTASNQEGLTAHRQRLHHMRGGTALGYEADVVVMLNEKTDAVSKVHLAYDGVRAGTFRHQVVFSVEKNRSGAAGLDMEFMKDFAYARFDPEGHWVSERLVDERIAADE